MSSDTKNIIPTLNELLKLEYLVASSGFSLLPKQPVHSILAGKHASKLRGRGLDFEEARKYVAGDDIRNIDWRVTARTKTTYTKVFTEEKEKPVLVITDLSPSMFFGSQVYTKSYIACQLAAIAAFKVLKNGDRMGGIVFNQEDTTAFAPKRNRKNILQYFKTLVDYSNTIADTSIQIKNKAALFNKVLSKAVSMATHDYLILIISDFINIPQESKKHIVHLSQHNDVIISKITDPLEEELGTEKLVLSDGDLQLLWESNKSKLAQKFKDEQKQSNNSFESEMKKYGIPIIPLNTVDPINNQLKSLFKNKLKK